MLKQWFIQNVDDPYPTDSDKERLAAESGLTIRQVSQWMINNRVQIKKKIMKISKRKQDTEDDLKLRTLHSLVSYYEASGKSIDLTYLKNFIS